MGISKPRINRKSKYEIDSGSEETHDMKYSSKNDKKCEKKPMLNLSQNARNQEKMRRAKVIRRRILNK